jgi:uncharacterized repeat protein (TIGR03809 family)
MLARQQPGPYDDLARKWLVLAERRKAHFIDLYESGRWKHYYTEPQIIAELRAAGAACDDWAKIVGVSPQAAARASLPASREAVLPDQRYRA